MSVYISSCFIIFHFTFQSKLIGRGGFFTNRLKYLRKKYNDKNLRDDLENLQLVETSLGPEEDLMFLKNCVIKNTDQKVIVAKLNSTRVHRQEMMRAPKVDLRESFPFFLAEPQLVKLFLLFYLQIF